MQRQISGHFEFLRKNFSKITYDRCADIIKEDYFMPGQIIIDRDDAQSHKLYLIAKGQGKIR